VKTRATERLYELWNLLPSGMERFQGIHCGFLEISDEYTKARVEILTYSMQKPAKRHI
jgi:hypothetical protein